MRTYETILKTTNGGVTFAEENIDEKPIRYIFFQNFTNPFNPSTKIKFQIAKFGFVTLKVYDILGREVATLVNEEKQPGVYEIEFSVGQNSSSDIASGIYFYTLKTEGFSSTKKMVYLK